MPKYFDLSAIAKELPDYEEEGDPPGSGENMYPYARAMLAALYGDRSYTDLSARSAAIEEAKRNRTYDPADYDDVLSGRKEDPYPKGVTKQLTDTEHVVDCFNDALAGILHGLSVRVAPGQMKAVVEHLIKHATFTMRWIAENEDRNDAHEKAENERDILRMHIEFRTES